MVALICAIISVIAAIGSIGAAVAGVFEYRRHSKVMDRLWKEREELMNKIHSV